MEWWSRKLSFLMDRSMTEVLNFLNTLHDLYCCLPGFMHCLSVALSWELIDTQSCLGCQVYCQSLGVLFIRKYTFIFLLLLTENVNEEGPWRQRSVIYDMWEKGKVKSWWISSFGVVLGLWFQLAVSWCVMRILFGLFVYGNNELFFHSRRKHEEV